MCGINIIVNTTGKSIKKPLALMQQATRYRGPDASQVFATTIDSWQVAVGVNRLQVVDREKHSNQPMISDDGNYVLAYNGEVYNYQDLKNRLIGLNYQFRTHSDTEVVLYWLQEFGAPGVADFKGMFAFAFIDLKTKKILTGRDRHGIKPLFIHHNNGELFISSSMRAIEASEQVSLSVNKSAISNYLVYRHVLGERTFYNEIVPHQPGLIIQYDQQLSKTVSIINPNSEGGNLALKQTLIDATTMAFNAPTPPGLLLSGGVDSTLLLGILRNELGLHGVNTYTLAIGADQKWAKKAARQYDAYHQEVPVAMDDLQRLNEFLGDTDQPIADSGAFATWLISAEAAKNSKVLLSGAGADELFGGYNRHRAYHVYLQHRQWVLRLKKTLPKSGTIGILPASAKRFLAGADENPVITYNNFLQNYRIGKTKTSGSLWTEPKHLRDNLKNALNFDLQNYLVADVLAITDNATMQNSVEARVPYLYDDIATIAGTISIADKMKNHGKSPLKEILAAYGGRAYCQRKKHGFGLPLATWFRDKKTNWLWEFLLHDTPLFEFIPKLEIYQLLRLHQSGKRNNSMQLWSILVLQNWLSRIS